MKINSNSYKKLITHFLLISMVLILIFNFFYLIDLLALIYPFEIKIKQSEFFIEILSFLLYVIFPCGINGITSAIILFLYFKYKYHSIIFNIIFVILNIIDFLLLMKYIYFYTFEKYMVLLIILPFILFLYAIYKTRKISV